MSQLDTEPPSHSTPRWVKVFVIIILVLLVLFVVMMLTGGHGPGSHTPGMLTGIFLLAVRRSPENIADCEERL